MFHKTYTWFCCALLDITFLIHSSVIYLTHWGRVTHICVGKLIIIGSDNGLSPGRRQAIIWTNAGIWSMRPLGTNSSEILITILIFSFKKMHLKTLSAKRRSLCLGLNELTTPSISMTMKQMYDSLQNTGKNLLYQYPLLLTWINFNPSMDK